MILKNKNNLDSGTHSKPASKKGKIIATLLVSSIVLFIIYFLIYWRTNHLIVDMSTKKILQETINTSETLSKTLKSDFVVLNSFSNRINDGSIKTHSIPEEIRKFINSSGLSFQSIFYLDKDEYIYSEYGKEKNKSKFLKNILNQDKINRFISGKDGIYTVIPIKYNPDTSGLLIGFYNSTGIRNKHLNGLYGDKNVSFITDSNGNILASGNNNLGNVNFKNYFNLAQQSTSNKNYTLDMKKKMLASERGNAVFFLDNKPYLVAFTPVNNINDWYQITLVPRSVALLNINYLVFVSVFIGAFIIFCLGVIGYSYIKSSVAHSESLHELAFNDPLTGYSNFLKFKIDAEMMLRRNKDTPYVLCYADLVGFKFINEAFGYEVGDQVLTDISKIFHENMREGETFARVSGDRFIALRKKEPNIHTYERTLYALVDKISKIPPLSTSRIKLEVHVGAYKIEKDNTLNINEMFDRAIIALETINHSNTSLAVYDETLRTNQLEKKNIEQKMESALNNGEFHVYIQPKYKASNKTLTAGEALIRWVDPEKGIIPPSEFIPIFEKNRFIFNLDRYVLEVVCRFIRQRIDDGNEVVPISLNVSPVEILMPHFTQAYISIKDKYNIPDKIIELEFTEGVFFENQDLFKGVIIELKNSGFCCSLDDFGSGFSSLNVLKEMPVDVLKLDKLFFKESGDIVRDRSIIRSVVSMARSLNIKTVAEGVETLETVEFLKLIGCNMIQGYIYSKPIPLVEFENLMDSEEINENDDFSDDYDKVSEIIPVDKPYDIPIRNTYEVIFEVNLTSDTYHMYAKEDCIFDFSYIDEIGEYSTLYKKYAGKKIHPDYVSEIKNTFNPSNLENSLHNKREIRVEYKRLDKNGNYKWTRARILKAKSDEDKTVIFIYIRHIDDAKAKDQLISVAQTRLSSAFLGVANMIFELNLNNGNLEIVKSFSKSMQKAIAGKKYEPLIQYIGTYLIHPKFYQKFNFDCSLDSIKQQFFDSSSKTIYYEYYAKSKRDSKEFRWYSVRFSYNLELSDKVLIAIKDITNSKKEREYISIRKALMEKAVKHYYDEILEINLDKDKYSLTSIMDRDEFKENIAKGNYGDYYSNVIKEKFLSSDYELVKEVLSVKGLWDMYNDNNISDFTLNIKKKDYNGNFKWYSLYIIPNRKDADSNDAIVFIFIKNIQLEKDLRNKITINTGRLLCTTNLFELTFDVNFKKDEAVIFGGKNIPSNIGIEKKINYMKLCNSIKEAYVNNEDIQYFDECMDTKNLLNNLKLNNKFSFFVRSKLSDVKSVFVRIIFDNRSKTATIFIESKNDDSND